MPHAIETQHEPHVSTTDLVQAFERVIFHGDRLALAELAELANQALIYGTTCGLIQPPDHSLTKIRLSG